MWRDARDAVLDMLQACDEIDAFLNGVEPATIGQDLLRLRAVERCLGILGEAAKRVPEDIRLRHPNVPWKAVAGLRDVLVHDYFGVDVAIVCRVVTEELPNLRISLRNVCTKERWE